MLFENPKLSPALWCVFFLFLTFTLSGEKITAFMEFGQVWCRVSGGKNGFLDHEVGKLASRAPQRHGKEDPTHGVESAGRVVCMDTDWVPRVTEEEVTAVLRR